MKIFCVATWCPLSAECKNSQEQRMRGTDSDYYVDYSSEVVVGIDGYTCPHFIRRF
jgi:hypothetical protein